MAILERVLRTGSSTIRSSLFTSSTLRGSTSLIDCSSGGKSGCGNSLSSSPPGSNSSSQSVGGGKERDLGGGRGGGGGWKAKKKNVHWVFLGCPGVGKGTYASRLSSLLGVPHIATGDLVRHELASSGSLASQLEEIVNQGQLVPDEFIFDLLSKRLRLEESKGESGFILDGFPRTVRQAEVLQRLTDIDLVLNLRLREEALIAKCLGRRICSECGGNYNIASIDIKGENGNPGLYMAPLLPPPQCASKLICRADDQEEVVKNRLRIYHDATQPVEDFYRRRGKLLEFDLPGGIPESWPKLLRALDLEDHDDHDDERSATA